MAAFFIPGEQKIRPGVYFRYEDIGAPPLAGVDDGKCAAVFSSDWGPVGKPVVIENYADIPKFFGDGGTAEVPFEQFKGGARLVYAVRLGSGGTVGSLSILDTAGTAVISLTLKYPGARAFSLTIRPTLDYPQVSELLLIEGTSVLQRITYNNTTGDDVQALLNAFATSGSDYFNLTLLVDNQVAIATIDQVAITGGTNPITNISAYSAAFEGLEAYRWNVLSIDTVNTAVTQLMQLFLNRIYRGGKFVMGVIGEDTNLPLDTRISNASAYNDYQIVDVGNGFVDISGKVYDGYLAAARIAGLIAGTPSNESITHLALTGAVDLTEPLTNNQYERAITGGLLTFSTSAANTVWVEQGINTLVLPGSTDDVGWKKIKRVKVRFELMQRLNDTVEPLVGRINNDPDGRMTVIQVSNGVCNAMVSERKLLSGAHAELDPSNVPKGDSAWFLIYADDIDALEKLYFTFKFRFAPDEIL